MVGVLVPFSLVHGFRADYLAPMYPASALLGAWALLEIGRRSRAGDKLAAAMRHVFAGAVIAIGVAAAGGAAYLAFDGKNILYIVPLAIAGVMVVIAAVRASLTFRIGRLGALACTGMMAVCLLNMHFLAPHARTGDGDKMIAFAREAAPIIGDDDFSVLRAKKVATEIYLGRRGRRINLSPTDDDVSATAAAAAALAELNSSSTRWLIATDRGLVDIGAARADENSTYTVKLAGEKRRFTTLAAELGVVRATSEPIVDARWGRIHLIELRRPISTSGQPVKTGFIPGRDQ